MAVSESIRAADALAEFQILVDRIVVNRCTPNLDHPFLQSRRDIEQGYLAELKDRYEGLNIHTVPLESSDIHGLDHLRRVGSHLMGSAEPTDPSSTEIRIGEPMYFDVIRSEVRDESDERTTYTLHLPGADRSEMGLRAEEGVLYISLNGQEKSLNIGRDFDPNSVQAEFNGDLLIVHIPR